MDLISLEDSLRDRLPTRSVEGLEGFPYASYAEFIEARKVGRAQVVTRYDSGTFFTLATRGDRAMHYSLTFSPFLLGMGLAVLAVAWSDYILLLGLPIALLGFLLSSPGCMRGIGALFLIVAAGAALYNWYYGNADAAYLWGTYAVSNFLTNVAREQCDMVIKDRVEHSEIVLVWLHLQGTIRVRGT